MAKEVGSWICMPKAEAKKLKDRAAACSVGSILKRKKKAVGASRKRKAKKR